MPDLCSRFGGHRQAAGLSLAAIRVSEFRERLNAYATTRLRLEDLRPQLEIDAAMGVHEITDRTIEELLSLAPFGCGNATPILALRDVELAAIPTIVKEAHVRMHLRQNGRTVSGTGWSLAERTAGLGAGTRLDAAVCFDHDDYARSRGWGDWSMSVKDF